MNPYYNPEKFDLDLIKAISTHEDSSRLINIDNDQFINIKKAGIK